MSEQQQMENERAMFLYELLDKILRAHRDGYLTVEDVLAVQREFGLAPHSTH